jgi:hypothetical protein
VIDADAECGCLMHKTIVTRSGARRVGTPARYLYDRCPALLALKQWGDRWQDNRGRPVELLHRTWWRASLAAGHEV